MRVLVAHSFNRRVLDQAIYYYEKNGREAAQRMVNQIRLAGRKLAAYQSGGLLEGLPRNYHRTKAKPFNIFYRVEHGNQLFVFLLWHERRRPLAPSTILRKAS